MEQENIRKETFLATLLLLAGTLILWKGYSYEPDSRQFPVFLGWLFVSFSILNAITLFKKFKAEKLSLSFEFHRPGFPLSLTILLLIFTIFSIFQIHGNKNTATDQTKMPNLRQYHYNKSFSHM